MSEIVTDAKTPPPLDQVANCVHGLERWLDPWHVDAFPSGFEHAALHHGTRKSGWMAFDWCGNPIGFIADGSVFKMKEEDIKKSPESITSITIDLKGMPEIIDIIRTEEIDRLNKELAECRLLLRQFEFLGLTCEKQSTTTKLTQDEINELGAAWRAKMLTEAFKSQDEV